MSDKKPEVPIWGSIHIRDDGKMVMNIPEAEEMHTEEFEKAKLMMEFIIFASNNADCINLFNVAENLRNSFDTQQQLQEQVESNIEKATACLNHKEIWNFIDDFHNNKFSFADENKPSKKDEEYVYRWLKEKDKITIH